MDNGFNRYLSSIIRLSYRFRNPCIPLPGIDRTWTTFASSRGASFCVALAKSDLSSRGTVGDRVSVPPGKSKSFVNGNRLVSEKRAPGIHGEEITMPMKHRRDVHFPADSAQGLLYSASILLHDVIIPPRTGRWVSLAARCNWL